MLIKKILSKFIKKLGLNYVKQITPEEHHKLISYIERDRRKRLNKIKRQRLMALLGEEEKTQTAGATGDIDMKSDDSESSSNEQGYEEDDGEQSERYSLGSDSDSDDESEDEEEGTKGGDLLMTDEMDIPRVDDIPVVSKLAKEKKEM